ncbi:MAG: DUF3592 domain-containing protein [Ardenticatenaceae bacterium]|nr:DUF3592 domain-containing protein [Ardenticatenaceae bacterium]MCB8990528.1 DUF3592 domain-containing protein [Ardenticatenaceae bacterium]MCB9005666.1 DUF3592 domain-containing protein [Ardenticatenaceae bacterium]
MPDWQLFILPALAVFVLLYYLILLGRVMLLSIRSRSWPQAEGRMITSKAGKSRHANPLSMRHEVNLEYAYTVDGQRYTSNVISFGDTAVNRLNFRLRSKRAAEKIVRQFPSRSTVTVYYNPQDPVQATLQPGIQLSDLIFTLVTLLIPLLMFVVILVLAFSPPV